MRKVEKSLSSFLKGEFKSSLESYLKYQEKEQVTKIASMNKEIETIGRTSGYTSLQREAMVEDKKKVIRRLKDRKAYFENKIEGLENIISSAFEKELKKNEMFDGLYVDDQDNLNLYTKMLMDKRKKIGRFRICIRRNQSAGINFKAVNLDYFWNALDHWAISENKCCLGEWEIDIKRVLFAGNIPEFFNIMCFYITLSPENHTYTTKREWYGEKEKRTKKDSEAYKEKNIDDICNITAFGNEDSETSEEEDENDDTATW